MKRMRLGVIVFLTALGCGGGGTSSSDTQASCTAYCTTYVGAACPSGLYKDNVPACVSAECVPLKGGTPNCQSVFKAYYDCEQAQADICGDTGCSSELAALGGC